MYCTKCKQNKDNICFNKCKSSKTGYQNQCKSCKKIHYKNNKEKYITKAQQKYTENKENILEYYKQKYLQKPEYYKQKSEQYRTDNTEKIIKYNKQRYAENKDIIKQSVKEWYINNKEHCILKSKQWDYEEKKNKRQNERYKNDINFRLSLNLRSRFNQALKNNSKKSKITELLGCSISEYKQYLESKFKPEMNWDNHGDVWEIDHILPCDSFDLTNTQQQKQCFHHTNTQPLFKTTSIAEYHGYNETGNRNKSNYE